MNRKPQPKMHRDEALAELGAMPARRAGESAEAFDKRKSSAMRHMAKAHGLTTLRIDGKRANRYLMVEVYAIADKIIHTI